MLEMRQLQEVFMYSFPIPYFPKSSHWCLRIPQFNILRGVKS